MVSWRELQPGQQSVVMIGSVDGAEPTEVFRTDERVVEAPNWTSDGRWLVVNAVGRLWRVAADGSTGLEPIDLDLPPLNNDHVLDPDGEHVYVSAADGHIYHAPLAGGATRRVTNDCDPGQFIHFLHGVSPDGQALAYIGLARKSDAVTANVFVIPSAGGTDVQLTFGDAPADGSEYSPDGEWIYLNTEAFSSAPGHAQVARIRPDGSGLEQLTFDDQVNWFPHWAPNGEIALYLSFPPGTTGHPADRHVELKLVRGDWQQPETVVSLLGGQGTANVNSWAPDSTRFGYVAYPLG